MTIEERVEKMERSVRRLFRVAIGLASLVLLGLIVWFVLDLATGGQTRRAAGDVRVVRAGEFVLVGEAGAERARLSTTVWGPALTFYDETGSPCAELSQTPAGPYLSFTKAGRNVVELSAAGTSGTSNGPELALRDNRSGIRTTLGLPSAGLRFSNSVGKEEAVLDGGLLGPGLTFYNSEGEVIAMLEMLLDNDGKGPGATYHLVLCDARGKPVWGAP